MEETPLRKPTVKPTTPSLFFHLLPTLFPTLTSSLYVNHTTHRTIHFVSKIYTNILKGVRNNVDVSRGILLLPPEFCHVSVNQQSQVVII